MAKVDLLWLLTLFLLIYEQKKRDIQIPSVKLLHFKCRQNEKSHLNVHVSVWDIYANVFNKTNVSLAYLHPLHLWSVEKV